MLHRRRPGVVVQFVVLRPERLEDELGSLETERDIEVGRNELGHETNRRTSTQGEQAERLSPGAACCRLGQEDASAPTEPERTLFVARLFC